MLCVAVGCIFGKTNKYRLQLWVLNSQSTIFFWTLNTSAIGFKTFMTRWWVGIFSKDFLLRSSIRRLLVIHFIHSSQILWSNITSSFFSVWFLSSHRREEKKHEKPKTNKQTQNKWLSNDVQCGTLCKYMWTDRYTRTHTQCS